MFWTSILDSTGIQLRHWSWVYLCCGQSLSPSCCFFQAVVVMLFLLGILGSKPTEASIKCFGFSATEMENFVDYIYFFHQIFFFFFKQFKWRWMTWCCALFIHGTFSLPVLSGCCGSQLYSVFSLIPDLTRLRTSLCFYPTWLSEWFCLTSLCRGKQLCLQSAERKKILIYIINRNLLISEADWSLPTWANILDHKHKAIVEEKYLHVL